MSKKILELQDDFLKKQITFKNAKNKLKVEFIGINHIIDEIIDNVSSWFMISCIPEQPIHQYNFLNKK